MILKTKVEELKEHIGEEISAIIANQDISLEQLHYLKRICSFSKEETELYNQRCKIDSESSSVMDSSDITRGHYIIGSMNVRNSGYVFNSSNIEDCNHIYDSENVIFSEYVSGAKNVKSCSRVVGGENIINSVDVLNSSNISLSVAISNSTSINGSNYIYNSKDLTACSFCGFTTNCTNCLFCSNLHDAKFHIFNKEVARDVYEKTFEDLLAQISVEYSGFITIEPISMTRAHDQFLFSNKIDSVFDGLSDEFFEWVKTLPNYSDFDFSLLFFR